jgi:alpha-N-arabinofuranosidase
MGRLRAENGHREPYNVRVWEIGNELYGDWQIGHTDPAGNAQRFVRFRDAMLKADPTIEIIATGKGDEFTGDGLKRDADWNGRILDAATAGGAAPPEYLSLHPLVPLPGPLNRRYSYDQIYASAMAHPQWWADTYVPALERQVRDHAGAKSGVKAAVTEWGIIVGGPNWLEYPNHDMQSGAIYAALFFHAMFRRADFVGLSNVTALMHGGGIKRWNSVVFRDPMYHVERLYGVARPKRLLPVAVSGPGYDVPERATLPAVSDVPWLDVLAAEGNGSRWLFVVNRDKDAPRTARITLPSAPRDIEITTLAAGPRERNTREQPDHVHPTVAPLHADGRTLTHAFAPCSVNIIRWR